MIENGLNQWTYLDRGLSLLSPFDASLPEAPSKDDDLSEPRDGLPTRLLP